MNQFEDNLWESVVDRHGDDLANTDAPGKARPRRGQARRGILAGGTLGLAAVGAGLVLAFSGSTAPPAFAITRGSDGSVLVHLRNVEAIVPAEHELAKVVPNEWFEPSIVAGKGDGAVTCTVPTASQAAKVSDATHRSTSGVAPGGPTVKVLLGSDGSETMPAGQATLSEPNGGPVHLMNCYLYSGPIPSFHGNTGAGNTGGN